MTALPTWVIIGICILGTWAALANSIIESRRRGTKFTATFIIAAGIGCAVIVGLSGLILAKEFS